jgi:excisionase family DNA binding protein
MTLDEVIRQVVREEVRTVVREELGALREAAPAEPGPERATELLDVAGVAKLCHATAGTVRTWIQSGRLAARKAGHRYLVRPVDVERFLSARLAGEPDVEGQVSSILDRLGDRSTHG